MARWNVRDADTGRFISAAESVTRSGVSMPDAASAADAAKATADALAEFKSAVESATSSILDLRKESDAGADTGKQETAERKKAFIGRRGETAIIGLFVGGLWKATRALDEWRKKSIDAMMRMQTATARFATIRGRATPSERMGAAQANLDAATKRWNSMGGPGALENLPWWAKGKELFQRATGQETDSQELKRARIEMEGAAAVKKALEKMKLGGDVKAGTYGFQSMGGVMQKQLVEADALTELTREQNAILTDIRVNTARRVGAVAP